MKLFQKRRCCECRSRQSLLQWLDGTQIAYVCTQCMVRLEYYQYLPSFQELL